MEATITTRIPIQGALQDKSTPDGEDAWRQQRLGGITSTEVAKWKTPSSRRETLEIKAGKVERSIGNVTAVHHGNMREPIIAQWVEERFGLAHSNHVYSHPDNPRYLASPDAVTVSPFSGQLVAGPDAAVCEIKTTVRDLTPGPIDETGTLIAVDGSRPFAKLHYFDQMQWTMFVMNAERCLFVWEVHTGMIDPDGDGQTYIVNEEPRWCWVPRSEDRIAMLLGRADEALTAIDANAASPGIPPVTTGDLDTAILVTEYLEALERESIAKKAKEAAWAKLKAKFLVDEQADDVVDLGFARVTISTYEAKSKTTFDEAAARAKAPALAAKWDALREKHTTTTPLEPTRGITVTRKAAE